MATPPTFSSGAVLTAAQMNSVGLWLVKTQTIGNAVSSISVTNAFSADYENYRILISGGTSSVAATYLKFALTGGSSVYDQNFIYNTYAGAAVVGAGSVNGTTWPYAGTCQSTEGTILVVELQQPFLTKYTMFSAPILNFELAGTVAGRHKSATSFTGFTVTPTTGTLTGGTIAVYGYKGTV